MVDFSQAPPTANDAPDTNAIEAELKAQFFKILNDRANFKVDVNQPNIKVSVWSETESKQSIITEAPLVAGVHPDAFLYFIDNWIECVGEMNPIMKETKWLEPIGNTRISRTVMKAPWPVDDRVSFEATYPCKNIEDGKHLLLISVRGAESRIVLTEKEKKDWEVATLFMAGWYFQAVRNAQGEIIGSSITMI